VAKFVAVVVAVAAMAGAFVATPARAAGPAWWDASYGSRLMMTVFTGSATASGYSLSATFDHAAAIAAGSSLSSGNDVRIVRWNGSSWTELDRVLDPASSWGSSTSKIWFRSPVALSATTVDTSFYLYYGNPSAGSPPSSGSNVFDLWDDFSGGALDNAKWTVDAGVAATQTGGELKVAGTTGMLGGGITSVASFGPGMMVEASVSIVSQSVTAHDNYQLCVTMSYWGCVFSNNAATKRVQWNDYGPWYDLGVSTLQAQTFGYHRLGIAMTSGGTVTEVEDGVKQFTRSISTFATQIDLNYHPFVPATFDVRFDNVYVRKYVANEPMIILDQPRYTAVSVVIDPALQFTVSAHAGTCNGVAQTAGTQVSGASVGLGRATTSATSVAAQDLVVTTNAGNGVTVSARSATGLVGPGGRMIAAVSGTNGSPGSFPALGTEGFGYTTDDAGLNVGGSATRFTSPSAKWAKLTAADAPVAYVSGPGGKSACVAYQAGVAPTTSAGTYAATVVYTAMPLY
jgi:hypothetical protein